MQTGELAWDISQSVESGLHGVYRIIKNNEPMEILFAVAEILGITPNALARLFMVYQDGTYLHSIGELKTNLEQYWTFYRRLEDEKSRSVFDSIISFRVVPRTVFIEQAFDADNPQYFDKEIIQTDENEVFVDCGGYTGDTVQSYIESFGESNYKAMYVYEPVEKNIETCRSNLSGMLNIHLRQAGVGEKSSRAIFSDYGSESKIVSSQPQGSGDNTVQVVSLDEDITEPVTFIKMDIEGGEYNAILGAKMHIVNDCPKLAVCVYHLMSDFWRISQLIHSINPGYRFYLRHYLSYEINETVLYAIPK